jgi:hypothetical protein
MRSRCNEPSRPDYKYYGGKGIKVCEEWQNSREAFVEWALSHGYADNLTIDRIDGDKNYCPENCRFITLEEQQRNKSNNYNVTHNGKTQTLAEWAKEYGLNRYTLKSRIEELGYSFEDALHKQYMSQKHSKNIKYEGNTYSANSFSKVVGATCQCVCKWINRGLSPEQIIEKFKNRKVV